MASAKFSVQLEQKSLCFKLQSGNLRLSRFLAFRFFLEFLTFFKAAHTAGVLARGGGQ
jgi:hypothetical protein